MRIALIGQQDFGKAVLEAFRARGDDVAAVFCAPESGRPDPLRLAAQEAEVPTHQFPRLTAPEAAEALRASGAELAVMAYVTQFVPQALCVVPRFGTIQFHPSLLPAHRGASAMSWAIIAGRRYTGLSIFRPTDGLDEGPVILQRKVRIEPDDTLGSLYFGKIFPLGVAALIEAAEAVVSGRGAALAQHEAEAGYEGIIGEAESRIQWASHIDLTYNLVRGCNPAPGAWTSLEGRKLFVFDCAKRVARRFAEVKGHRPGEVVAAGPDGISVLGQGGFLDITRLRWADGRKIPAAEAGILAGAMLGT